MGKIWVISDPHFGDGDMANEGLRPHGFDEKIIAKIGLYVNPGDTLICLGDVCWADHELWHQRLGFIECRRWLVLGNHDKKSINWYLDHGWHWVGDSFRMTMFGKRILFSHYPMADKGDYDLNIHGHFHNFGLEKVKEKEPDLYAVLTPKHKLIAMEDLNYEPIKLQRICESVNISA